LNPNLVEISLTCDAIVEVGGIEEAQKRRCCGKAEYENQIGMLLCAKCVEIFPSGRIICPPAPYFGKEFQIQMIYEAIEHLKTCPHVRH
jgi:hypothetical protein